MLTLGGQKNLLQKKKERRRKKGRRKKEQSLRCKSPILFYKHIFTYHSLNQLHLRQFINIKRCFFLHCVITVKQKCKTLIMHELVLPPGGKVYSLQHRWTTLKLHSQCTFVLHTITLYYFFQRHITLYLIPSVCRFKNA